MADHSLVSQLWISGIIESLITSDDTRTLLQGNKTVENKISTFTKSQGDALLIINVTGDEEGEKSDVDTLMRVPQSTFKCEFQETISIKRAPGQNGIGSLLFFIKKPQAKAADVAEHMSAFSVFQISLPPPWVLEQVTGSVFIQRARHSGTYFSSFFRWIDHYMRGVALNMVTGIKIYVDKALSEEIQQISTNGATILMSNKMKALLEETLGRWTRIIGFLPDCCMDSGLSAIPHPNFSGTPQRIPNIDPMLNFLYSWKLYCICVSSIEQQFATQSCNTVILLANKTLNKTSPIYTSWREAESRLKSHSHRAHYASSVIGEIEYFLLTISRIPAAFPTFVPNKLMPLSLIPRSVTRDIAEGLSDKFFNVLSMKGQMKGNKLLQNPVFLHSLTSEFVRCCEYLIRKEIVSVMGAVVQLARVNGLHKFSQSVVDDANNDGSNDFTVHSPFATDTKGKGRHNGVAQVPNPASSGIQSSPNTQVLTPTDHTEWLHQLDSCNEFAVLAQPLVDSVSCTDFIEGILCLAKVGKDMTSVILSKEKVSHHNITHLVVQNDRSLEATFSHNANLALALITTRVQFAFDALAKLRSGMDHILGIVSQDNRDLNFNARLDSIRQTETRVGILWKRTTGFISLINLYELFCSSGTNDENDSVDINNVFSQSHYSHAFRTIDIFSLSEKDLTEADAITDSNLDKIETKLDKIISVKFEKMFQISFDHVINFLRRMPKVVFDKTLALFVANSHRLIELELSYFQNALTKIRTLRELAKTATRNDVVSITQFVHSIETKVTTRHRQLSDLQNISREFVASEHMSHVDELYNSIVKVVDMIRTSFKTFWKRNITVYSFLNTPMLKMSAVDGGVNEFFSFQYEINMPKDLLSNISFELDLKKNGIDVVESYNISRQSLFKIREGVRALKIILSKRSAVFGELKRQFSIKFLYVPLLLQAESFLSRLTHGTTWSSMAPTLVLKRLMKSYTTIDRCLNVSDRDLFGVTLKLISVLGSSDISPNQQLLESFTSQSKKSSKELEYEELESGYHQYLEEFEKRKFNALKSIQMHVSSFRGFLARLYRPYLSMALAIIDPLELRHILERALRHPVEENKRDIDAALRQVYKDPASQIVMSGYIAEAGMCKVVRGMTRLCLTASTRGLAREMRECGRLISELFEPPSRNEGETMGNEGSPSRPPWFKVSLVEAHPTLAFSMRPDCFIDSFVRLLFETGTTIYSLKVPRIKAVEGGEQLEVSDTISLSCLEPNKHSSRTALRLILCSTKGYAKVFRKCSEELIADSCSLVTNNQTMLRGLVKSAKLALIDTIVDCHSGIRQLDAEARLKAEQRLMRKRRQKKKKETKTAQKEHSEVRDLNGRAEQFISLIEGEFQEIDKLRATRTTMLADIRNRILSPFVVDHSYISGDASYQIHRAISKLSDLLGFGIKVVIAEEKLVIGNLLKTLAGINGLLHVKTQDDMKTLVNINPATMSYISTKMRQATNTLDILESLRRIAGHAIRTFIHKDSASQDGEGMSGEDITSFVDLDVTKETVSGLSLRLGRIDRRVIGDLDKLIQVTQSSFVQQQVNYGEMLSRYKLSFSNLYGTLSKQLAIYEHKVAIRDMYAEINVLFSNFEKSLGGVEVLDSMKSSKGHIRALLRDARVASSISGTLNRLLQKAQVHQTELETIDELYAFLKRHNSSSGLSLTSIRDSLATNHVMIHLSQKFFKLFGRVAGLTIDFIELRWEAAAEQIEFDLPGTVFHNLKSIFEVKVPRTTEKMREAGYKGSQKAVQYLSDIKDYVNDIFLKNLREIISHGLHKTSWISISAMIEGFTLPPPGQALVRDFLHLDFVSHHNDLDLLYYRDATVSGFQTRIDTIMGCFDRDMLAIKQIPPDLIPSWVSSTSFAKFINVPLAIACRGRTILADIAASTHRLKMCRLPNKSNDLTDKFAAILNEAIAKMNMTGELLSNIVSFQNLVIIAFNLAVQMRVDYDARLALFFGRTGVAPHIVSVDLTGDLSRIRFPLNRPHDSLGRQAILDTTQVILDKSPDSINLMEQSTAGGIKAPAQHQGYSPHMDFKHNSLIPDLKATLERSLIYNMVFKEQMVETENIQAMSDNNKEVHTRKVREKTKGGGDSASSDSSHSTSVHSTHSASSTQSVKSRSKTKIRRRERADKNRDGDNGPLSDPIAQSIRQIETALALDNDDINNLLDMFPEGRWFPRGTLEQVTAAWDNMLMTIRGMNSASEVIESTPILRNKLRDCAKFHVSYFDEIEKGFILMQRKICPQLGILSTREILELIACPELPSLFPRCDWNPNIVRTTQHGYISIKDAAKVSQSYKSLGDVISEDQDVPISDISFGKDKREEIKKAVRVMQKLVPGLAAFIFSRDNRYIVGAVLSSDVEPQVNYTIETLPKILFFSRPVTVGLQVTESVHGIYAQTSASIWLQMAIAELCFSIKRNFYFAVRESGLLFPSDAAIKLEVMKYREGVQSNTKTTGVKQTPQQIVNYKNTQDSTTYVQGGLDGILDNMPMVAIIPYIYVFMTFYYASQVLNKKSTCAQFIRITLGANADLKKQCLNILKERTTLYTYPLMFAEYFITYNSSLNCFANLPTKIRTRYKQFRHDHYANRVAYRLLKKNPKASLLFRTYKVFIMVRFLSLSAQTGFLSQGGKFPSIFAAVLQDYQLETELDLIPNEDIDLVYLSLNPNQPPALSISERGIYYRIAGVTSDTSTQGGRSTSRTDRTFRSTSRRRRGGSTTKGSAASTLNDKSGANSQSESKDIAASGKNSVSGNKLKAKKTRDTTHSIESRSVSTNRSGSSAHSGSSMRSTRQRSSMASMTTGHYISSVLGQTEIEELKLNVFVQRLGKTLKKLAAVGWPTSAVVVSDCVFYLPNIGTSLITSSQTVVRIGVSPALHTFTPVTGFEWVLGERGESSSTTFTLSLFEIGSLLKITSGGLLQVPYVSTPIMQLRPSLLSEVTRMIGLLLGRFCFELSLLVTNDQTEKMEESGYDRRFFVERTRSEQDKHNDDFNYVNYHMMRYFEAIPCVLAINYDDFDEDMKRTMGLHMYDVQASLALHIPRPVLSTFKMDGLHLSPQFTPFTVSRYFTPLFGTLKSKVNNDTLFDCLCTFSKPCGIDFLTFPPRYVLSNIIGVMSCLYTAKDTFHGTPCLNPPRFDLRGIDLNHYLGQVQAVVDSLNSANTSPHSNANRKPLFAINSETKQIVFMTTQLFSGLKSFGYVLSKYIPNLDAFALQVSHAMAHILYTLGLRFDDNHNAVSLFEEHVVYSVLRVFIKTLHFVGSNKEISGATVTGIISYSIFVTFYFGIRPGVPFFKRMYYRNIHVKLPKGSAEGEGTNTERQHFALTSCQYGLESPDEKFMRIMTQELISEFALSPEQPTNPRTRLSFDDILFNGSVQSMCPILGVNSDPLIFTENESVTSVRAIHPMMSQLVCNTVPKAREEEVKNGADQDLLKGIKSIADGKINIGRLCDQAYDIHLIRIHRLALDIVRNHPEIVNDERKMLRFIFVDLNITQLPIIKFLTLFIKLIDHLSFEQLNEKTLFIFKLALLLSETNKVVVEVRHTTELTSLAVCFSYALAVISIEPYLSAYRGSFREENLRIPQLFFVFNKIRMQRISLNLLDGIASRSKWTSDKIFIDMTSLQNKQDFQQTIGLKQNNFALFVKFGNEAPLAEQSIVSDRVLRLGWTRKISTIDLPGVLMGHAPALHFRTPYKIQLYFTEAVWASLIYPMMELVKTSHELWINESNPMLTRIDSRCFDNLLSMAINFKLYLLARAFHMYYLEAILLKNTRDHVINRVLIRILGDETYQHVVTALICDALQMALVQTLDVSQEVEDKIHELLNIKLDMPETTEFIFAACKQCEEFQKSYNLYSEGINVQGNLLSQVAQNIPLIYDWNVPELEGRRYNHHFETSTEASFFECIRSTTVDFYLFEGVCCRNYLVRLTSATRFFFSEMLDNVLTSESKMFEVFGTPSVVSFHVSYVSGIDSVDEFMETARANLNSILVNDKESIVAARNLVVIVDAMDMNHEELSIIPGLSISLADFATRCSVSIIAFYLVEDSLLVAQTEKMPPESSGYLTASYDKFILECGHITPDADLSRYNLSFKGIDFAIFTSTDIDGVTNSIFRDGYKSYMSMAIQRDCPHSWRIMATVALGYSLSAIRNFSFIGANGTQQMATRKDLGDLFDVIHSEIVKLFPQALSSEICYFVAGLFFVVAKILEMRPFLSPEIYDASGSKEVVDQGTVYSSGFLILDVFVTALYRLTVTTPFSKMGMRMLDFPAFVLFTRLRTIFCLPKSDAKTIGNRLRHSPLRHGVCFLKPKTKWAKVFQDGYAEGVDLGITKHYIVFAEDLRVIFLLSEAIICYRRCRNSSSIPTILTYTSCHETEWIIEATINLINKHGLVRSSKDLTNWDAKANPTSPTNGATHIKGDDVVGKEVGNDGGKDKVERVHERGKHGNSGGDSDDDEGNENKSLEALEFNAAPITDTQRAGTQLMENFNHIFFKLATARATEGVSDEFKGWSTPQCICFEIPCLSSPLLMAGPIRSFLNAISELPFCCLSQYLPEQTIQEILTRHNSTVTSAPLSNSLRNISRFIRNRIIPVILITNPQSSEQMGNCITRRFMHAQDPCTTIVVNPNKSTELKTLIKASMRQSINIVQKIVNGQNTTFHELLNENSFNFFGNITPGSISSAFLKKYDPVNTKATVKKALACMELYSEIFAKGLDPLHLEDKSNFMLPIETTGAIGPVDIFSIQNNEFEDSKLMRETIDTLSRTMSVLGSPVENFEDIDNYTKVTTETMEKVKREDYDDPMSVYQRTIRPVVYETIPIYEKLQSLIVTFPKVFTRHISSAKTFTFQMRLFSKYEQMIRLSKRARELAADETKKIIRLETEAGNSFNEVIALRTKCYDNSLKLDFLREELSIKIKERLDNDKREGQRGVIGKKITQSRAILEELRRMIYNTDEEGLSQVRWMIAFLLDCVKIMMAKPIGPIGTNYTLVEEKQGGFGLFELEEETIPLPTLTTSEQVTKASLTALFDNHFVCCLTPEVYQLVEVYTKSNVYTGIRQTFLEQLSGTAHVQSSTISEATDPRLLVCLMADWIESVLDSGGEEAVSFISTKKQHDDGLDKLHAAINELRKDTENIEEEISEIEQKRGVFIREIVHRKAKRDRLESIAAKVDIISTTTSNLLLTEQVRKQVADITFNMLEYSLLLTSYYVTPEIYYNHEPHFMARVFDKNPFIPVSDPEIVKAALEGTVQPTATEDNTFIRHRTLNESRPSSFYTSHMTRARLHKCGTLTETESSLLALVATTPYVPVIFDPWDIMGMMVFAFYDNIRFFPSAQDFVEMLLLVGGEGADLSILDSTKLPPISYVKVTGNDLTGNSAVSGELVQSAKTYRKTWPNGPKLILLCREKSPEIALTDFSFIDVPPTATALAYRHACQSDHALFEHYQRLNTKFDLGLANFRDHYWKFFNEVTVFDFDQNTLNDCVTLDGDVNNQIITTLEDHERMLLTILPHSEGVQSCYPQLRKLEEKIKITEKLLHEETRVHVLPAHILFASEHMNRMLLAENLMVRAYEGERHSPFKNHTIPPALGISAYATMRRFAPLTERDIFDTVQRYTKVITKQQGKALQQVENQIMYRQNTEILMSATKSLISDSMAMMGHRETLAVAIAVASRLSGTNRILQIFALAVIRQSVRCQDLKFDVDGAKIELVENSTKTDDSPARQRTTRRKSVISTSAKGTQPRQSQAQEAAIIERRTEDESSKMIALMQEHAAMDVLDILERSALASRLKIKAPLADYTPMAELLLWSRSPDTLFWKIQYVFRDTGEVVPFDKLDDYDSTTIKGVLVNEADAGSERGMHFRFDEAPEERAALRRELYTRTLYIWFNAILTIILHPTKMLRTIARCLSAVTSGCIDANSILFGAGEKKQVRGEDSAVQRIKAIIPSDSYYFSTIPLALADGARARKGIIQLSSMTDLSALKLSLDYLNHCNDPPPGAIAQPFEPAGPVSYVLYNISDPEIHNLTNIISIVQQPLLLVLALPSSTLELLRELMLCSGEHSLSDGFLASALGSKGMSGDANTIPWWLPLATEKRQLILMNQYSFVDGDKDVTAFTSHPLFRLAIIPGPFIPTPTITHQLAGSRSSSDLEITRTLGVVGTDILTHTTTDCISLVLGRRVKRFFNLGSRLASSVMTYNDITHFNGKSHAATFLDLIAASHDMLNFNYDPSKETSDTLVARAYFGLSSVPSITNNYENQSQASSTLWKDMPAHHTLKTAQSIELMFSTLLVIVKAIYLDFIDNQNKATVNDRSRAANVDRLMRAQKSDRAKSRFVNLQREQLNITVGQVQRYMATIVLSVASSVAVDSDGNLVVNKTNTESMPVVTQTSSEAYLDDLIQAYNSTTSEVITTFLIDNDSVTNATKGYISQLLSGNTSAVIRAQFKNKLRVGNVRTTAVVKDTLDEINEKDHQNQIEDATLCASGVTMLLGSVIALRKATNDPLGVTNKNSWQVRLRTFLASGLGIDFTNESENEVRIAVPAYRRMYMYSCFVAPSKTTPTLVSSTNLLAPSMHCRDQISYRRTCIPSRSGPVTFAGIMTDFQKLCVMRLAKAYYNQLPPQLNLKNFRPFNNILQPAGGFCLLPYGIPAGQLYVLTDLHCTKVQPANRLAVRQVDQSQLLANLGELVTTMAYRKRYEELDTAKNLFLPPFILPAIQSVHFEDERIKEGGQASPALVSAFKRVEGSGTSNRTSLIAILYPLITHYNNIVRYFNTTINIMRADLIDVANLYDPQMSSSVRLSKQSYTIGIDLLMNHLPTKWDCILFDQYGDEATSYSKKLFEVIFLNVPMMVKSILQLYSFLECALSGKITPSNIMTQGTLANLAAYHQKPQSGSLQLSLEAVREDEPSMSQQTTNSNMSMIEAVIRELLDYAPQFLLRLLLRKNFNTAISEVLQRAYGCSTITPSPGTIQLNKSITNVNSTAPYSSSVPLYELSIQLIGYPATNKNFWVFPYYNNWMQDVPERPMDITVVPMFRQQHLLVTLDDVIASIEDNMDDRTLGGKKETPEYIVPAHFIRTQLFTTGGTFVETIHLHTKQSRSIPDFAAIPPNGPSYNEVLSEGDVYALIDNAFVRQPIPAGDVLRNMIN